MDRRSRLAVFAVVLLAAAAAQAQPVPTVSLTAPAQVFIGESIPLEVTFDNTGDAPGYGPFVDLVLPVNGADGAANTNLPLDGISFASATYLGTPVTTVVLTFPDTPLGTAPCGPAQTAVDHPWAVDTSHTPLPVCGTPGDVLVAIQLPFGSFVPDQPPAPVSVNLDLSNFADLGTPLAITTRGGFQFGLDPLDNPCCDSVLLNPSNADSGAWPGTSVTPTLITLTKEYQGPEDETATGPNFPRQYQITVTTAPGQTVTDLDLTDDLPENITVTSVSGATLVSPATLPVTGGTLAFNLPSVTGSATITVDFFVPLDDSGATPVIDPTTGDDAVSDNLAEAVGDWTPLDPRDTGATDNAVAGSLIGPPLDTFAPKSIAIQKGVAIAVDTGAAGASPGDTLEYTLSFQVSDFFAVQNIVVTDILSDGQRFDPAFTPTLSFTEHGSPTSGPFDPANVSFIDHFTGGSPAVPPVDGTAEAVFRVSDELVTRLGAGAGSALGGCVPAGGTGGPTPDCAVFNGGGSVGTIVFRAVVQQNFTDVFPSGDPSVDHGDTLDNSVEIASDLLSVADLLPTGSDEADTSGAGVTILQGGLTKGVYAVNGSTTLPSPLEIAPGDTVTYRLTYTLPSTNFEDLVLTDYLPLPVFDAGEIQTFSDVADATPPAAGVAKFGPADTFRGVAGLPDGLPSLTTDPSTPTSPPVAPNTVVFDYGDHDDPTDPPSTIDLLFTLTVTDEPFADNLFLTNQARAVEGSTNSGDQTADDIVQIVLREPFLAVRKGACGADNPDAVYDPPLSGGACPGGVTSDDLTADPNLADSNVEGLDAGDIVSFALVIENQGGSGAFDITLVDTLTPGFCLPGCTTADPLCAAGAAGMNLAVVRGDGFTPTLLPQGANGDDRDLFANGLLLDDTSGTPVCQPYTPADGTNTLTATYDLEVCDPALLPGSILSNQGGVSSFAGTDGGPNHVDDPSDWSDSADVTLTEPGMTKSLVGTGIVSATNAATEAVIGELVTYQLTIALPEGDTPNLSVTDTLPAGMAFVGCTGIVPSDGAMTASAGSFADICTGPSVAPGGGAVTFDFDTLTNPDNDSPPNDADETLTITYQAVVLNVAGNQAGTALTNSAALTYDASGGTTTLPPVSGATVTVIEPTVGLTKTASPTAGDAGDTVTFTLRVANGNAAGDTDARDVTLSDTIPVGLSYVPGTLAVDAGQPCTAGAPALNDGSAPVLSATWPVVAPNSECTLTYDATIDLAAFPTQSFTNTADLVWSSLPGPKVVASPFNPDSTERDGSGGVDDYATSDQATVTVDELGRSKSIVATSEAHTAGSNVAVGEVVRYRLVTTLPEGTTTNLQVRDLISNNILFLDTDTARVAFVSNQTPISSADVTGAGLTLGLGNGPFGTAPWVNGNAAAGVTPTFALPEVNVGASSSVDTDANTFGNGTDVYFKLGTVVNSDSDADDEFVIIEFNALVLNSADNDDGDTRSNRFRVRHDGRETPNSNNASITIREPEIADLDKSVVPTSGDADDPLTYTFSYSNTGSTTAFEVRLLDVLPATVTATLPATVTLGGGAAGVTDASAGNTLDITIAEVPAGGTVQVDLSATIVSSVPPNTTISNTASVTYTSLPGAGTSGNPTGDDTPGGSGATDGERDDSGGPNDYLDSDSATVNTAEPGLGKVVFATSEASTGSEAGTDLNDAGVEDLAVGETVTYRLTATIPEGLVGNVVITDTLPVAPGILSVQSASVVAVGGDLYTDDTLATPASAIVATTDNRPGGGDGLDDEVVFTFGQIYNNPDNDSDADDQITLEVVALVENLPANTDDTDLVNTARMTFDGGIVNATDVTVEVVEPELTVDKTAAPTSGDAGDTITFTLDVAHAATSTADAFDLILTDVIPADMTYATGTLDCTGGSLAADSCVESAGTITVDWAAFPLGSTTQITFDVTLDPTVVPGQSIQNSADLVWDSLDDDATPNDRDDATSDSDTVVITEPGLTKVVADVVTDTSVAATGTAQNGPEPDLTIGETVTYTLTVTIPEGTQNGAVLVDQLPNTLSTPQGVLEYVSHTVTPGGNIVVDSDPGTPGDQLAAVVTSDSDLDGVDDLVTITFGMVNNVADGVSNSDDDIVVTITARVLDVPVNQGGVDDLPNSASYTWTGAASPLLASTTVDLVEPLLDITKTNLAPFGDAGDTITYEVEIAHTGASTADAHEVIVVDTLPAGQSFVQLVSTGDPLPAVTTPIPGQVVFTYVTVPRAAGSYTFRYEVLLDSSVESGASYTNTADLSWTSLPGDGDPEDRVGTDADTAEVTINAPALVKVSSDTSLGDTGAGYHDAGQFDLAIGELVTYTVTVTFPEGTTSNVVVTDQVQADGNGVLEIHDLRILSTGADITTTSSVISPSPILPGTTVGTFDLGTVTNTPSDGGAITDNDRIVFEVVARVVDEAANADADTLVNLATLDYLNGTTDDDDTVDVVEPDMAVVKTMSNPVDQVVTLTVALTNNGAAPGYDIVIEDVLPAATWDTTTIAPVSIPAGFTFASVGSPGDATVTLASDGGAMPPLSSIEPTETVTFVFSAELVTPLPPSPISNTATNTDTTTLPGPDPEERDEPDASDDDQLDFPVIEVDKSAALAPGGDADGSGTPSPGDILRYTITVTNSGSGAATNVVLTDPVNDPNLALVTGTVTADNGGVVTLGNGGGDTTVQVDWASLAGGSVTTVTFDVVIASPVAPLVTAVVNWSTVASDELPDEPSDDPDTPADDDPTVVPLDAAPDLTVTKDDGVPTAAPGDTLTYTLTISNVGTQDATGVAVTDTLPVGTSFSAASDGGSETVPGSGVVTWPAFSLAAGDAVTRTVTVTVDQPAASGLASLVNTATVADDGANGPDPTPGDNTDTDTDTLDAAPDLALTKDDGGVTAGTGDTIAWTLSYANTGDQDATGVVLTETVPAYTTFNSGASTAGWVCVPDGSAGSTCTLAVGALAAGSNGSAVFAADVDATLPDGVDLTTNSASIDDDGGNGPDPTPDDNSDTDDTPLVAVPDLVVTKDDGGVTVVPGETFAWTLAYDNVGDQDATGVVLTETVPDHTTFDAASSTPGWVCTPDATAGSTCTLAVGTVASGAGSTADFAVTVDDPIQLGVDTLTNAVSIADDGSNGDDPTPDDNSDTDDTPVTVSPALEAAKADALLVDGDGDGQLDGGDTLRYTVELTATGDVAVPGVVFEDTPGAHLTLVAGSVTTSQGTVVSGNTAGDTTARVDVGTLAVGPPVTVTFDAVVDDPLDPSVTSVSNQGLVYGDTVTGEPTDDPDTPAGDDPTDTPVGLQPVVDAIKSDALFDDADSSGSPSAGDVLEYTVEVANSGTADATGVVFTDTPDANTALVAGSVTTTQGSVTVGNTGGDTVVEVDLGTLTAGTTATVTFRVTIDNPLPLGTSQVSNQGLVSSDDDPDGEPTDDPDTPADDDPTDTPVSDLSELEATKLDTLLVDADGNSVASPGDTLRYVTVIENVGAGAATGVVFTDTPDPLTTLVAGSVVTSQGTVTSGNTAGDTGVAVDIGVVDPGVTVTVRFDAVIANPLPAGTTRVANQGLVASDGDPDGEPTDDPDTPTDDDPTDTDLQAEPDLVVTKDDGLTVVTPPTSLTYTITVDNVGTIGATGIVLTDTLPGGTVFASASDGGFETAPGVVEWPVFDLAVGDSVTRTVTITVPDQAAGVPGVLTNTATAVDDGSNGDDPTPDDNTDTDTDTLDLSSAVEVAKSVSDPATNWGYQPNDIVTWTVAITNIGNQEAVNLQFVDPIPTNTSYVAGTIALDATMLTDALDADAGAYDGGAEEVLVTVDSLPAGATRTVTFSTALAPLASTTWTVVNQATVTSTDGDEPSDDPTTTDDDDPTSITVGRNAIPALDPIGMAVMVVLLALAAAFALRRR